MAADPKVSAQAVFLVFSLTAAFGPAAGVSREDLTCSVAIITLVS